MSMTAHELTMRRMECDEVLAPTVTSKASRTGVKAAGICQLVPANGQQRGVVRGHVDRHAGSSRARRAKGHVGCLRGQRVKDWGLVVITMLGVREGLIALVLGSLFSAVFLLCLLALWLASRHEYVLRSEIIRDTGMPACARAHGQNDSSSCIVALQQHTSTSPRFLAAASL